MICIKKWNMKNYAIQIFVFENKIKALWIEFVSNQKFNIDFSNKYENV